MDKKKVLIILGVILIVLQLASIYGVSRMYVGLFPDKNSDIFQSNSDEDRFSINVKAASFALEAGFDRFKSGFEDITFPKDEYRDMSVTQRISARLREAYGCSDGGSIDLIIYDFLLIVSFSFVGLVGIALLIAAAIIHRLEWA